MNISNNPKEHTIRIRITDDMHRHIQEKCNRHRITTSEYIRGLIDRDIKNR